MLYGVLGVLGVLLGWFWFEKRHRRTRPMTGGIHRDVLVPYQSEYELYHNDFSLCSKKVRVCLAEAGVAYEPHHIELIETGGYETIGRSFLKVNPAGILPVLVHNGHPIYESHDIISYVADQHPGCALVPEDPDQRALMQRFKDSASIVGDDPASDMRSSAAACVSVLTLPLFAATIESIPYRKILEGVLFHRIRFRAFMFLALKAIGLARLTKIRRLSRAMEIAKRALHSHLAALDELLTDGRDWIVGHQFSLADVSWMVLFDRLVEADWYDDLLGTRQYANVHAYYLRLKARQSHAQGIDAHRHPVVTEATQKIRQLKRDDAVFAERMLRGCAVAA